MNSIRVILADDHKILRNQVAKMLAPEFNVIAAVGDSIALFEAEAEHKPDIVILDISMPGLSGFDAARLLQEAGTKAKIVFLTVHSDRAYVEEAFSIGGQGYVIKSRLASDLVVAIKEVSEGRSFVSPTVVIKNSN